MHWISWTLENNIAGKKLTATFQNDPCYYRSHPTLHYRIIELSWPVNFSNMDIGGIEAEWYKRARYLFYSGHPLVPRHFSLQLCHMKTVTAWKLDPVEHPNFHFLLFMFCVFLTRRGTRLLMIHCLLPTNSLELIHLISETYL